MTHICHANGCGDDSHPAMPFCKRHAEMLPGPHKKRLWDERRRDTGMSPCAACDPFVSEEARLRRGVDWDMLYNLAIAIFTLRDFGGEEKDGHCGCGAPVSFVDDGGFCWSCGILGATKLYGIARRVLEKYAA